MKRLFLGIFVFIGAFACLESCAITLKNMTGDTLWLAESDRGLLPSFDSFNKKILSGKSDHLEGLNFLFIYPEGSRRIIRYNLSNKKASVQLRKSLGTYKFSYVDQSINKKYAKMLRPRLLNAALLIGHLEANKNN